MPRSRSLLLLGVIGAAVALAALAARVYTDLLWFQELGMDRVYWTTLEWKILAKGFAGLGTTVFVLANLTVAERLVGRGGPVRGGRLVAQLWPGRHLLYPLAAIACGVVSVRLQPHDAWSQIALWAHRTPFGAEDPLFHRDVGFFVFSLPLYELAARWLLQTVVMAGAAAAAVYAVAGLRRAARAHLLVLAAVALAIVSWKLHLERFRFALPHGGVVPGASNTEARVVLPALRVLALVPLAYAAVCLYATVRRVPLLLIVGFGLVGVAALAGRNQLPDVVDALDVQPQKLTRERPYIEDAIAATRRAFALDDVDVRPFSNRALTAAQVRANGHTLDNVPLWDLDVLRPAMNELQAIGRYYAFPSATLDRYKIDGDPEVMVVAARQLDIERVEPDLDGWATQRFAYTHGYGVVAVHGGETDSEYQPRFVQRGFGTGANPLQVQQPRIYFGEEPGSDPPYLIVNSHRAEIDRPAPGSRSPRYHYDGDGGIALSSFVRRAAFAARFADPKLLLSETVTRDSRIVTHRDVGERLRELVPFLRWDDQAQTAVIGGRVQFLFYGYTTSDRYPYSERVDLGEGATANYIRAAAVAAVDAFDGHVSVYAVDEADPILRAWRAVYPRLFLPAARMPDELGARLRYPGLLFAAQADAYATYHAENATSFWNGDDAWQTPLEVSGPVEEAGEIRFPDPEQQLDADERRERHALPDRWQVEPSYLLARLPGDARERFLLTTMFAPRGSQNLVGYLAGSVDARGRPRLAVLSLPRDRLELGPSQATRRILAHPAVSRRLELLNRESRDLGANSVNRTILGAPRLVPVGGTLVYVQPLYLTAAGSGVPRLQFVTVIANGRVGYGRTLRAALARAL